MKKDLIFFGEKGLTSTSANHIANLAKEYITETESVLNNIIFYKTEVSLLDSPSSHITDKGTDLSTFKSIPSMLNMVSKSNSLIAWLREAIRAKKHLTEELELMSVSEFIKTHPLSCEYCGKPEYPTDDDYFETLSIKERNEYYQLEAKVSVIGKYIHPSYKYHEARKKLLLKIQSPVNLIEKGKDSIVYSYTPVITIEEVNNQYFELQKLHRELQSRLNGIKHSCEDFLAKRKQEIDIKYQINLNEYNHSFSKVSAEFECWKNEELKKILDLKIIIPNDLEDIYNEINKLGK